MIALEVDKHWQMAELELKQLSLSHFLVLQIHNDYEGLKAVSPQQVILYLQQEVHVSRIADMRKEQ